MSLAYIHRDSPSRELASQRNSKSWVMSVIEIEVLAAKILLRLCVLLKY